jgi:hypothetical protein
VSHHAGAGSLFLGVILVIGTILHVHGDESRANLTSDTHTAKLSDACITIDMMERQYQLLMVNDYKAWHEYMQPRRDIGFCKEIAAGTRIAVEKRLPMTDFLHPTDASFGNWYCVRPYGDPTCYWEWGTSVFGKPL